MKKYLKGRKIFVLLWFVGFCCGIFAERQWKIVGYEVMAATPGWALEPVWEESGKTVGAEILPIVFYDDMGRKVCVRRDAVLQLSEAFCMEIPLDSWSEGQAGLVEITIYYEDGAEQRNCVCIQRKSLHNEEK